MKENVPEKISLPLELKLHSIWGELAKGWEIREERLNVWGSITRVGLSIVGDEIGWVGRG